MKRFDCPVCSNEVYFDSTSCVQCGSALGFAPHRDGMQVPGQPPFFGRPCRNAHAAGCNWLIPGDDGREFCAACRHNNVVPDPDYSGNRSRWVEVERAKRHLIYALMRWSLPHPTRAEDPNGGLAFDFLAEVLNPDGSGERVETGHLSGLITLSIAEGDDVIRTERKTALAESYRTLIGHMRHEIGHYYWRMLVEPSVHIDTFRALFGDERQDYGQALQAYYGNGAPDGWEQTHISAYATAHPWEDFAETWSHWMHIVDGLETAAAYGIRLGGQTGARRDPAVAIDIDPYRETGIQRVVDLWVPLTVAVNSLNRGMGQPDLYPFVLSRPVEAKLSFINTLIHAAIARPA